MWQEIAVIIIGALTLGYVGRKIYRMFAPSENDSPCAGCPGCCMTKEPGETPDCEKEEEDVTE
jgi:hypothetical protein